MYVAIYIEVNIVCIAVLFLCWWQLHNSKRQYSTDNMVFDHLLFVTVLFCAADIAAIVFRGSSIPGARALVQISNLVYLESLTIISYLWLVNVSVQLGINADLREKKLLFCAIPLILFTIVALSNPFTHFLFSVDENNLYVRGDGIWVHWVVSWSYLLCSTVLTARAIVKTKNKAMRDEIKPLLYFIIAPIFACTAQMLFYGITSNQVGITISIVLIFLYRQNSQVLADALTHLNNRRGFDRYCGDFLQHHKGSTLCILMLDLDNFKQVNDRFGHITGDKALAAAADALKSACADVTTGWFLCRYGGDEFLLAGMNCTSGDIERIKSLICEHTERANDIGGSGYRLSFSIGVSKGVCFEEGDVEQLLHAADAAMYETKKEAKLTQPLE